MLGVEEEGNRTRPGVVRPSTMLIKKARTCSESERESKSKSKGKSARVPRVGGSRGRAHAHAHAHPPCPLRRNGGAEDGYVVVQGLCLPPRRPVPEPTGGSARVALEAACLYPQLQRARDGEAMAHTYVHT